MVPVDFGQSCDKTKIDFWKPSFFSAHHYLYYTNVPLRHADSKLAAWISPCDGVQ